MPDETLTMSQPSTSITAAAEAENLLRTFGDRFPEILGLLERQLNALHMRAQVLIGFAAVAVTTTGFSGRLIAGTNVAAQVCIIMGLAIILLSCFWVFLRVLNVDWVITRYLQADAAASLAAVIDYRNRKTRAYRQSSYGIFLGLTVYAVAIAIMLLNPVTLNVPVR